MENNKSDTLEQRKKAQREFIELKKMQSGEIAPRRTDGDAPVFPTTFKGRLQNYWYHYKVHTILIAAVAALIAILITQCATQKPCDVKVLLSTNGYYVNEQIERLEEYLKQYCPDVDGNGEVTVSVIDCSYSTDGQYDNNYVTGLAQKMNALIASDGSVQIFIVDEKNLNRLNELAKEYGGFFADSVKAPESLHSAVATAELPFPDNLIIGRRIISGTAAEKDKDSEKYEEIAKSVIGAVKQANKK